MDLKPAHSSPIIADPVSGGKSRLGLGSNVVPFSATSAGCSSSGLHLNSSKKKTVPSKIEEIIVNGWFDAMVSSSPPRKKLAEESADNMLDDAVRAYHAWLTKYPSALTCFPHITTCAKDKKIALFLDYDGTLSPIVDNPDNAIMSAEMRAEVENVAKFFPTAIISGRSRDKVSEFVRLTELYYAGSHGMDILGPPRKHNPGGTDHHASSIRTTDSQGKEVNLFQPASEFLPMMDEVFGSLAESTKSIDGATMENNKFCVSVHYRHVDEENYVRVHELVMRTLQAFPRLRLTYGRKVLEIRPAIDWNKGKAVEFLLESLGLSFSADVFPIYIGDDNTDEDAFKVLKERNLGHGILVSSTPKVSDALYSLRDPSEVMMFLKSLAKWKETISL